MPQVENKPSLLREIFRSRGFVAAFIILLVAAVGLNASVQFLELHFRKEPVPMRKKFSEAMPEVMGPWVRVATREMLEHDVAAELGTDKYLFCAYINAAKMEMTPETVKAQFAGKSYEEQHALVQQLRQRYWDAILDVSLTYYTGKADTVAHIPERCFVGNGYEPVNPADEKWNVGGRELPVRHILFDDQLARGVIPCDVAYFFHNNGEYDSNRDNVRVRLQNLRQKYGYYAKVELMGTPMDRAPEARARVQSSMEQFLAAALPHMESALPDWNQYAGK
jgi:hypothetical protein